MLKLRFVAIAREVRRYDFPYDPEGKAQCQGGRAIKDKVKLQTQMTGYMREKQTVARQVSQIGFIWPGTIVKRRFRCGKKACACHSDPTALRGPYVFWTTKKNGKTVGKLLKDEHAELIHEWIENRKRLDPLVKELLRVVPTHVQDGVTHQDLTLPKNV